jgi:anthranilate synthase/aminodeoxychorismate synthase-like glutamine amidotransferase
MSARILLLDNYDSFTFNLAQSLWGLGAEVRVVRNDKISVAEVAAWGPSHVVISPGPGRPENAGISVDLIRASIGRWPLLGVCLGHQALAHALSGTVTHAPQMMHGKSSRIQHAGDREYSGLSQPMTIARYHSLIVLESGLPTELEVSARTETGEVMGIRHRSLPVYGVQFHPESVLSPEGDALLANFLATPDAH